MNLALLPHRPHGRPVFWVVPLLQRVVQQSVDRWPTDVKPLVAPQVQQKRTSEEDRLGARLGAPGAHAPVRRGQNRSTLFDLGHLLHGGVSDPPRMEDEEPQHRASPGTHRTSRSQRATTGTPPSACCSSAHRRCPS
jgi:hypothetical protein